MDTSDESALTHGFIDAERCIAELQRGRAIALMGPHSNRVTADQSCHIVQLVETLSESDMELLMGSYACHLVLSRSRALALNMMVDSNAVCLDLGPHTPASTVRDWAGLHPEILRSSQDSAITRLVGGVTGQSSIEPSLREKHRSESLYHAKAALNLARHAHVLPAFITYTALSKPDQLLGVSTEIAASYSDQGGQLIKLSTASVPLATAENAQITVFRERHGNAEHVAITVGQPDFSNTVTVRIHSSCFTGDILGSMKCDCGEQLQRAISSMAEDEGGVVLYISQEGRGIGLASKLLAYQLQDQGLDTIEANQHLGFEADERRYQAAVYMLEQLGISSVRLMTNNPLKIEALRHQGVHVEGRVPSPATVNVHNARYLKTKRERAGHLASCDNAG